MPMGAAGLTPPAEGAWVEEWLSAPRFTVYLGFVGDDREAALRLYEWNARVSAALAHDLAHLEVGLRNAYDRALTAHLRLPAHWTACEDQVFAPLYRVRKDQSRGATGKARVDINARPRESLERAVREVGGPRAPAGKVIAQLTFGFWRYLTSAAHEVTLWRPALHHAFPPGTSRSEIDMRVGRLHRLRNRVAHHEPLLAFDIGALHQNVLDLAGLLGLQLHEYITSQTAVPALLQQR